jgi:hypothetical protein
VIVVIAHQTASPSVLMFASWLPSSAKSTSKLPTKTTTTPVTSQ